MAVSASGTAVRAPRGALTAVWARARTPRVVLPLAFLLTAGWLGYQSWHVNSYVWLIDELLYMKYAVSYSDFTGFMPAVHGMSYGAPNLLWPVLAAPLFWVFGTVDAFTAAHVLNAILFASTMFPVYLTARRVGATWPWAVLAGLAAVWVPWSVASLTMMTEATAYPAFAWAVLAITAAVADPRPKHDVLAVVAIVLAILARTQLVFLVGVFPVALLIYELSRSEGPPWRERLRAHRALLAMVVAVALMVAFVQLTGGNLLGAYEVTTTTSLLPLGLWDGMMVHVSHLIIGVTIVPALLWAAWLLVTGVGPASNADRAAALVSGLAFGAMIYQAGWFTRTIAGGAFQERYTLYAVALFAVGMAAVASRVARPAPRVTMLVATGLAVVAVAGSQFGIAEAAGAFGRVASAGAGLNERWAQLHSDANAVIPGRDRSVTEIMALVTLLAGLALALAFTPRVRRWALPALCVLALLGSILQTRWLFPRVIEGIAQSYPSILAGVEQQPRDWIDRAAPDGATVGLQPGRLSFVNDGDFWMWTEFWNKEADREYTLTGISPYTGWPGHKLAVDQATGRVTLPEDPDLLVISPTDPTLRLAGEIVERSAYGVALMKPAKPFQALWRLEQSTYDGAPKGPNRSSTLRIYAPSERVAVTFTADTAEGPDAGAAFPFVVEDEGGVRRHVLRPGAKKTVTVSGADARLRMPEVTLSKKRKATVRVTAIREAGA